MAEELRECPFCGSDDVSVGSYQEDDATLMHILGCDSCGAELQAMTDRKKLISTWNTRLSTKATAAPQGEASGLVEELRSMADNFDQIFVAVKGVPENNVAALLRAAATALSAPEGWRK